MSGPAGSEARMLREISVVQTRRRLAGAHERRYLQMAEIELQYHYVISGTGVSELSAATTFDIAFEYRLYEAPGQRDNLLDRPHFTYGVELDNFVGIHAAVLAWNRDTATDDAYIGATVGVGAVGPAGGQVFSGRLHLSFQGYGALDLTYDPTVQS